MDDSVHICKFICCGHGLDLGMYSKDYLSGPLDAFSYSAQHIRVAACTLKA